MSTPAARPGPAGAAGAVELPDLVSAAGSGAGVSTPELSDPPETLGVGPEIPLGAGESGSIRMATVLTAVGLAVFAALAVVTAVAATSIVLAVVPE